MHSEPGKFIANISSKNCFLSFCHFRFSHDRTCTNATDFEWAYHFPTIHTASAQVICYHFTVSPSHFSFCCSLIHRPRIVLILYHSVQIHNSLKCNTAILKHKWKKPRYIYQKLFWLPDLTNFLGLSNWNVVFTPVLQSFCHISFPSLCACSKHVQMQLYLRTHVYFIL